MKVNGNQMNAIPFLLFSVVVSGSLGGYVGYQGFPQPIPAPYFPFPYNVVGGPAPLPLAPPPPPALRFTAPLPANLPQHYYTPPGNTYRGFSYETDYPNGGSSQVVFVTGPQSRQLMQQSFASFRQIKPLQPKLRVLTVTPTPEINVQVLTVAPTVETNSTPATTTVDLESISVSNPTPVPLPSSPPLSLPNAVFTGNPTASVYRVQVFPSHIPQYQHHHFLQAPFPYHPIFSSFYNAVPQFNATGNSFHMQEDTKTSLTQQENANDGQESMINEVGTLPAVISNRIDSPVPAGEPVSTASTSEPLNSSPEPVATTTAQQSSSMEAVTTSTQEAVSMEAAVTTSAPESSSTEAITTSSQEPSSMETGTTQVQQSSSVEGVTSESVDLASRIQADASTEAAEEGTTSENTSSTGGDSNISETTSTASVSEENIMPTATTESSTSSGTDEQTTAEQTTEA